MPDLVLIRDGWHPNLCIYSTANDRCWDDAGFSNSPHVSTFSGLIVTEFVRTRRDMQRFTFVGGSVLYFFPPFNSFILSLVCHPENVCVALHVMTAVGFGAADINHYLPFVEHTFYERVIADTMLCFLAEAQAPKVCVYRGADWASLMDAYIAHHTGQRSGSLAESLQWRHCLQSLETTLAGNAGAVEPTHPPTTVLGALLRLRSEGRAYLDGIGEPAAIQALDDGFRAALRASGDRPSVMTYLDDGVIRVRAWPAVLRQMAVEHVRMLVRRLRLLPRSPDLPTAAGALSSSSSSTAVPPGDAVRRTAAWLWRIRAPGPDGHPDVMTDDDSDMHLFESVLIGAVTENLRQASSALAS